MGETTLLLTTSLGIRKIAEEEEEEEERGDILLSFLMSFTAIRLTSRKGGKGEEEEEVRTGRIILTLPCSVASKRVLYSVF